MPIKNASLYETNWRDELMKRYTTDKFSIELLDLHHLQQADSLHLFALRFDHLIFRHSYYLFDLQSCLRWYAQWANHKFRRKSTVNGLQLIKSEFGVGRCFEWSCGGRPPVYSTSPISLSAATTWGNDCCDLAHSLLWIELFGREMDQPTHKTALLFPYGCCIAFSQ